MNATGKTHIVHITQYLTIGGLESLILEFCRKMDKSIYSTTVLCLNGYDEQYKKRLEQCGTAVHLIKKSNKFDFMFLWRAASFLKSIQTDLVHSHGGCFLYSSIIGKLAGVKGLIYTAHGMPVTFGLQARVEEFFSCIMTDSIVAVSDEIAKDLESRQKGFTHKIRVIINGIDPEKYKPIEDKSAVADCKAEFGLPTDMKIIGSVGRLEKVKNYPLLLSSFAEMIQFGNDKFHLVLVGCGEEDGYLKKMTHELGIAGKVTFLGMQYDLHRIYPLFDVFVLSSLTEGTSLSLLEAQSCGVPAVVTDVGGNSNVIRDGFNGFLFPSGDQTSMATLLYRLLNNGTERLYMGQSARMEILDRFDLTTMVRKYQQIYNDYTYQDVTTNAVTTGING